MKIRNSFLVLITLLSISQSVDAQLLWEISGKNITKKSYLFGTHHLIPISFLDSVPDLFKSFNTCDVVIGEMAINNIDFTSTISTFGTMPDSIRIAQLIDRDDYLYVDSVLQETVHIGLRQMELLNPSLISAIYQLDLYSKTAGITDELQSDSYFQVVAAYKGMEVIGLETEDRQIALLINNEQLQKQAHDLVKVVRNSNRLIHEFRYMNKLYTSGKIEDLVTYAKSPQTIEMTDSEYAKSVDNRNTAWMEQLPGLIKNQACFIAVGALHLGGEKGLIRLLKDAGYKVNPVK
ncbi:MAG: TraB/GumN family protein [Prevotellaceae bacterium]|jgi:uncharacterized protein YbaP (TraB family)|nr:TraB/GumN family protein [Prevotellaceae bacterium]